MNKSLLFKIGGLILSFTGTILLGQSTKLDNDAKLESLVKEHFNKSGEA